MAERFRHGRAEVTLGGGLARYVRRVVGELPAGVVDAVHLAVGEFRDDVMRRWPVKTGRSRAGFKIEIIRDRQGRAAAEVRLFNDVRYVRFIRQKRFSERRTWVRLVEGPAKARAREIQKRAFQALFNGVIRGDR